MPTGAAKASTKDVYDAFDARDGAAGYDERVASLRGALANVGRPRDLAALPANDLARSALVVAVLEAGAFRADVSGAGPALYGLFHSLADAERARRSLRRLGATWVTVPAWYG